MRRARGLPGRVLLLLLVATLTFLLSRIVPADPAAFLAGQNASAATVARIRAEYGLDQPLAVQFASYVADLVHGISASPCARIAGRDRHSAQFLPATLELLVVSFVGLSRGQPLLAVAAVRRPGGPLDSAIRLLTMLGSGIPVFWLGMALQFVFFYRLHWLPLGGRFPIRDTPPPDVTGFLLVNSLLAGDRLAFLARAAMSAAAVAGHRAEPAGGRHAHGARRADRRILAGPMSAPRGARASVRPRSCEARAAQRAEPAVLAVTACSSAT